MGSKPKAPPVIVPVIPEPDPDALAAALPTPAPQSSPTARAGSASNRSGAALAAGLGMNNTILTGARGLSGLPSEPRRTSLLGL